MIARTPIVLFARHGETEPPFELWRGTSVHDHVKIQTLRNLAAELGAGWNVWLQIPVRKPIGCNVRHRRSLRERPVLAMSPTEASSVEQAEIPTP